MRIIDPRKKGPKPKECYWLLAPECEGGMAFIPECWGGANSGPDGCFCRDERSISDEALADRIEVMSSELAELKREQARRADNATGEMF